MENAIENTIQDKNVIGTRVKMLQKNIVKNYSAKNTIQKNSPKHIKPGCLVLKFLSKQRQWSKRILIWTFF